MRTKKKTDGKKGVTYENIFNARNLNNFIFNLMLRSNYEKMRNPIPQPLYQVHNTQKYIIRVTTLGNTSYVLINNH